MGALERIGAPTAPPPAVMRLLGRYSREELAMFVTVAIDLIDLAEPDPDREEDDPAEADGDEDDGGLAEDEPCAKFQFIESGPGCFISDAREEDDHAGECSEDEISCGPGNWGGALPRGDIGPGCEISDPGGRER